MVRMLFCHGLLNSLFSLYSTVEMTFYDMPVVRQCSHPFASHPNPQPEHQHKLSAALIGGTDNHFPVTYSSGVCSQLQLHLPPTPNPDWHCTARRSKHPTRSRSDVVSCRVVCTVGMNNNKSWQKRHIRDRLPIDVIALYAN
jgi:hypothetical protein